MNKLAVTLLCLAAAIAAQDKIFDERLIGSWTYGTIPTTVAYENPITGSIYSGSGYGTSYTFSPNGKFIEGSVFQITTYGCSTKAALWQRGAILKGSNSSSFTLAPIPGGFGDWVQTCGTVKEQRNEYNKAVTFINYRFDTDSFGTKVLYLTDSTGREQRYSYSDSGSKDLDFDVSQADASANSNRSASSATTATFSSVAITIAVH